MYVGPRFSPIEGVAFTNHFYLRARERGFAIDEDNRFRIKFALRFGTLHDSQDAHLNDAQKVNKRGSPLYRDYLPTLFFKTDGDVKVLTSVIPHENEDMPIADVIDTYNRMGQYGKIPVFAAEVSRFL